MRLKEDILGLNVFVYCYNEPVSGIDPNGNRTIYKDWGVVFESNYNHNGHDSVIQNPKYTSCYKKSKSMLSQDEILSKTSKYACTVVAITELLNQQGLLKNSISSTFNKFWKETKTKQKSTGTYDDKEVIFGSTVFENIKNPLNDYYKNLKNTCRIKDYNSKYKTSPKFSFFRDAIDNNYSIIMGMSIYVSKWPNGYRVSGHSVNVVGYCIVNRNGKKINYLIVCDGWSKKIKYLNFTDTKFYDICAYRVKVRK